MRGPGPTALLERAIIASACAHGVRIAVEARRATRWESATFSGARHGFDACATAGATIERWLDRLPEEDIPMRGHLVADLAITATTCVDGEQRFTIEALTVATP